MSYRLLLDIEVVEFIEALPRGGQIQLRRRLGEIQTSPTRFADFQEREPNGRLLDVHVHRGLAIYYWDDFADRHVKVFRIRRADTLDQAIEGTRDRLARISHAHGVGSDRVLRRLLHTCEAGSVPVAKLSRVAPQ